MHLIWSEYQKIPNTFVHWLTLAFHWTDIILRMRNIITRIHWKLLSRELINKKNVLVNVFVEKKKLYYVIKGYSLVDVFNQYFHGFIKMIM